MYVLAQTQPPVTPTDKQIAAAELVAEKILSGIPTAAESNPVQYLNMVLIFGLFVLVGWLARRVFAHLESKNVLEATARREMSEEARQSRESLQRIADGFGARELVAMDRERDAQASCHAFSLAMQDKAADAASRIAQATSNLQVVTTDLKGAVHDVRNIAQENKNLVETILFDRGIKPVNVNIANQPKIDGRDAQ